jgi:hypothetical protein
MEGKKEKRPSSIIKKNDNYVNKDNIIQEYILDLDELHLNMTPPSELFKNISDSKIKSKKALKIRIIKSI